MKTTSTTKKTKKTKTTKSPYGVFTTRFLKRNDTAPILAAYRLRGKILIVVERYSLHAAYKLRPDQRAEFIGYVGQNGPSRHILHKAEKLDAKLVGARLQGHVFDVG